jgi:clan AA aspartic protease (TIGR02281 family)
LTRTLIQTRTTKVKTILLTTAAVAAMTVSAYAALDCGPTYIDFGPQKGPGVVRTFVVYEQNSRAWSVQHTLANGATVERNAQYAIADQTDGRAVFGWTGTLRSNPQLQMTAEVRDQNGQPVYNEWLYRNGQLIFHSVASCQFDRPAQNPPAAVYAPPAPMPAPAATTMVAPIIVQAPAAPAPVIINNTPAAAPVPAPAAAAQATSASKDSVQLFPGVGPDGATDNRRPYIDVTLGGLSARMLLDTGATDLVVTEKIADELVRSGDAEWIETAHVKLADGTTKDARYIRVHRVAIGSHILHDIEAGVTNSDSADLLIGFPVINEIGRFTIDSRNRELIFG